MPRRKRDRYMKRSIWRPIVSSIAGLYLIGYSIYEFINYDGTNPGLIRTLSIVVAAANAFGIFWDIRSILKDKKLKEQNKGNAGKK